MENIEPVPLKRTDSLIPPLLTWLAIQLAALAVICFRIPLWAKYPQPPDALAAATILVVQSIAAAILFPLLFQSIRSSLVITAAAWPFLLAAGAIASVPTNGLLLAGLYQTLLFAVLCLWGRVLNSRPSSMGGSGIAVVFIVGPAVLEYLRLEFNPEATLLAPLWRPTPLAAGINALGGSMNLAALMFLVAVAIPAVLMTVSGRRTSK